ncbi:tetratricopeptide repeat protein 1 [Coffea eugenioides]|uniref:tetratricopeptide repeat protein 1 n=1 Tax=Coffea eugenioides TaxID=49369 RepID=UPI000F5C83E3|nr:tetratricopeptide repeat protein 1-like [Coffea arabica]XP_027175597.1 tetratricopeptide repeat protein 1 [Coffea eugenioides]
MVVIEPVESNSIGEKVENTNEKVLPKTKPPVVKRDESTTTSSLAASSSSSSAARIVEESTSHGNTAVGDASDGFETASEADLNDDEDDLVGEEQRTEEAEKEEAKEGNREEGLVGSKERDNANDQHQEQQVDLNQEQIIEKALAEANDAKLEGNTLFKDGQYEEALSKYDIALQAVSSIPESVELRSVCHANRAACYSKMKKFEDTIKECTKALELNASYIKVLLRRAEAHEMLEHFEEAIADITKVLEVDPSHDQARRQIVRLKPLADEKREKMKEEMIGKLKEMGNSLLGRFGMSVDNFKAVKDPNTGSYSVSFQR